MSTRATPGPAATDGSYVWALQVRPRHAPQRYTDHTLWRSEITLGNEIGDDICLQDDQLEPSQVTLRVDVSGRIWAIGAHEQPFVLRDGQTFGLGRHLITLVRAPRRRPRQRPHAPPPEVGRRAHGPADAPPQQPPRHELLLRIVRPDQPPQRARLPGPNVEIGTDPQRDIPLHDPTLDELHCSLIVTERGEVIVRDHHTRTGTRLNHELIRDVALMLPGDQLRLGSALVTLEAPPRPLNTSAWRRWRDTAREQRKRRHDPRLGGEDDPEARWRVRLMVSEGGVTPEQLVLARPRICGENVRPGRVGRWVTTVKSVTRSNSRLARVPWTRGSRRGWWYGVMRRPCGPPGTRALDNDIILPAGNISKHHAELRLDQGQLWLRDLDSVNGTRLVEREHSPRRSGGRRGGRPREPRPAGSYQRLRAARGVDRAEPCIDRNR